MISYDYFCLSFSILQDAFGVRSLRTKPDEMMAALYLQVSIISQALIFVTRSRSWSFIERPGLLLATAFVIAQLVRVHFHLQILIPPFIWPLVLCQFMISCGTLSRRHRRLMK